MKELQSDELMPRHIKALTRALREAASWRGSLVGAAPAEALAEFDAYIATAKEGMKRVRELGRQQAYARRRVTNK